MLQEREQAHRLGGYFAKGKGRFAHGNGGCLSAFARKDIFSQKVKNFFSFPKKYYICIELMMQFTDGAGSPIKTQDNETEHNQKRT